MSDETKYPYTTGEAVQAGEAREGKVYWVICNGQFILARRGDYFGQSGFYNLNQSASNLLFIADSKAEAAYSILDPAQTEEMVRNMELKYNAAVISSNVHNQFLQEANARIAALEAENKELTEEKNSYAMKGMMLSEERAYLQQKNKELEEELDGLKKQVSKLQGAAGNVIAGPMDKIGEMFR